MEPPELRTRLAQVCQGGAPSSDFDLNAGLRPKAQTLRPAGVLMAIRLGAEPRVVLTRRSARLKHHAGQVAFPGGKVDPGDSGPIHAALREAEEEIGLARDCVDVVGTLPPHETVTAFNATPVIGLITAPFTPRPEEGEVAEVFDVPLSYLADPGSYRVEGRYFGGTRRFFYVAPYGPHYIWGATARILRQFAERWSS